MHPSTGFSAVTEFVILFTLAAPFLYTLLAYQNDSHQPTRKGIVLSLVVLIWTATMFGVVACGIDGPAMMNFPGRPLVYLLVPVTLAFLFRRQLVHPPVSQRLLVSLQLWRVIGMAFVWEWSRGVLPGIFAHPAGWGDLLSALIAAGILWRYRNTEIPRQALILLATVGIADFVSAFFFGFFSSASPVQLFSHELPNRVAEYPTGLIPMFLVPFATIGHVLSLSQLPPKEPVAR